MYIYIHTYKRIHMHVYIFCVRVSIYTHTHTHTHIRVCVCVCVYICVRACVFKWKNKSAWNWARETECAGEARKQQIREIARDNRDNEMMQERGSESENMSTWQHSWTDAIETIEYFFYQMTFSFLVVVTDCVEVFCLLFACWLFQSAKCVLYAMSQSASCMPWPFLA